MADLGTRFRALDVLRGLTVALMIVVNMSISDTRSYAPLLHAAWHGLTLTDLVFPTFMFVVGAALSFSLDKHERLGDGAVLRKILTRTVFLFLCGYLLYWFPFFRTDATGQMAFAPVAHTRILGVLQRIALGYGIAALIVHFGRRTGAVTFGIAALLGYWWLLGTFGDYSLTGNAELKLDRLLLGEAHLYHGEGIAFDPEGILSTLPAVVNVLAGYLAGCFVRERGASYETIAKLLMVGAACVIVAICWNPAFPMNKKLWTSSYVLCTVGIDLGALATLLYLVDLLPTRSWTYFFEVFGRNALFVYVVSEVAMVMLFVIHVGQQSLFRWLYEGGFASWAGDKPGSLLYAIAFMAFCWVAAYALDRNRIYIKL